jgi:hypothetical protein
LAVEKAIASIAQSRLASSCNSGSMQDEFYPLEAAKLDGDEGSNLEPIRDWLPFQARAIRRSQRPDRAVS